MKMRKAQKEQRKLSCKMSFLCLFCRDCPAVRKAPEGTETNGREAALVQGVWGRIPQQAAFSRHLWRLKALLANFSY